MSVRLGLNGKLYVGTAGSQANTELDNAKDVTITLDKAMADTSRRSGGGWRSQKPTLKNCAIEFVMFDDPADGNLATIRDAFLNDTTISLWARDAATGEGPDADFNVAQFNRNESLEEGIQYNVRCVVDTDLRVPTWS